MIHSALIVYTEREHAKVPGRVGEFIEGIGWAYEPLHQSGLVDMLHNDGVRVIRRVSVCGSTHLVRHMATNEEPWTGRYLINAS